MLADKLFRQNPPSPPEKRESNASRHIALGSQTYSERKDKQEENLF